MMPVAYLANWTTSYLLLDNFKVEFQRTCLVKTGRAFSRGEENEINLGCIVKDTGCLKVCEVCSLGSAVEYRGRNPKELVSGNYVKHDAKFQNIDMGRGGEYWL